MELGDEYTKLIFEPPVLGEQDPERRVSYLSDFYDDARRAVELGLLGSHKRPNNAYTREQLRLFREEGKLLEELVPAVEPLEESHFEWLDKEKLRAVEYG